MRRMKAPMEKGVPRKVGIIIFQGQILTTRTDAEHESDGGEGEEPTSDSDGGDKNGMVAEDDVDWDLDTDDMNYERSPVAAHRGPSHFDEEQSQQVSPGLVSAHFSVELH